MQNFWNHVGDEVFISPSDENTTLEIYEEMCLRALHYREKGQDEGKQVEMFFNLMKFLYFVILISRPLPAHAASSGHVEAATMVTEAAAPTPTRGTRVPYSTQGEQGATTTVDEGVKASSPERAPLRSSSPKRGPSSRSSGFPSSWRVKGVNPGMGPMTPAQQARVATPASVSSPSFQGTPFFPSPSGVRARVLGTPARQAQARNPAAKPPQGPFCRPELLTWTSREPSSDWPYPPCVPLLLPSPPLPTSSAEICELVHLYGKGTPSPDRYENDPLIGDLLWQQPPHEILQRDPVALAEARGRQATYIAHCLFHCSQNHSDFETYNPKLMVGKRPAHKMRGTAHRLLNQSYESQRRPVLDDTNVQYVRTYRCAYQTLQRYLPSAEAGSERGEVERSVMLRLQLG